MTNPEKVTATVEKNREITGAAIDQQVVGGELEIAAIKAQIEQAIAEKEVVCNDITLAYMTWREEQEKRIKRLEAELAARGLEADQRVREHDRHLTSRLSVLQAQLAAEEAALVPLRAYQKERDQ